MHEVADLAFGPPDPQLTGRGELRHPLVAYDLATAAALSHDAVAAAARHVRTAVGIITGVAREPLPSGLAPLLDALDLVLTEEPSPDRRCVCPAELGSGLDSELVRLADNAAAHPQAAVTCALLLRQTQRSDVWPAMTAESAAYSTLLAGGEFARWLSRRGTARTPLLVAGGPVGLHRDGNVLRVELRRPARRNAIDAVTRDALAAAFDLALADGSLRVEVSGQGPDFCAGGDIDEFGTAPDPATAHIVRLAQSAGWRVHLCRERTTFYLHGACAGAGVEIPSFAGRVLAAPGTRVGLPELTLGLLPGAGGTVSIPRRIGRWRTLYMFLSGQFLDASAAQAWGLVDEVGTSALSPIP